MYAYKKKGKSKVLSCGICLFDSIILFSQEIFDIKTGTSIAAAKDATNMGETAKRRVTDVIQTNEEASAETQEDSLSLQIRDSGVEICLIELERHSPDLNDSSVVDESMELLDEDERVTLSTEATQTDLVDENCDLKTQMEAQNQKLVDAEGKICELEDALKKLKEAEERRAKAELKVGHMRFR